MVAVLKRLRCVPAIAVLVVSCLLLNVGSAYADDELRAASESNLTVQVQGVGAVYLDLMSVAGRTPERPLVIEQGKFSLDFFMVTLYKDSGYSVKFLKGSKDGEMIDGYGRWIETVAERNITIESDCSNWEPGDYVIETNCEYWSWGQWRDSAKNPRYYYMTVVARGDGSSSAAVDPSPYDDLEVMHRLYNSYTDEHFYTASQEERDVVVAAGWRYEGIGWVAPKSGKPVYRVYNPIAGEHHYTLSSDERADLIAVGWVDEEIGWYSDPNEAIPLYREYNPNMFKCNHNYTADQSEHESLVTAGWTDEGIGWYGV